LSDEQFEELKRSVWGRIGAVVLTRSQAMELIEMVMVRRRLEDDPEPAKRPQKAAGF
jgi:hypothetical protein